VATLQDLEKDFKTLIKNEALGHAYALYGPYLPGQFTLAKSLANFLEHKKWAIPEEILLDAKFIDGTQQNLGVDVAREFSEFLYRQPVASPRRTLVINSAAEFTDQAQNAILKIVEEPPSHALIILTVRDINSLLVPLKSRLQSLYVAPAKGEQATRTELEEKADELVEKVLMSVPAGRSAIIKQIVTDDKEDDVEKNQKITDTFLNRLILALSKKPEANAQALKEALKRQTAMADYSTNKKLQLEAILQFLK
jgi:DNA polymerase III delta prime subunit